MLAREPGDTNAPFREGKYLFRRGGRKKGARPEPGAEGEGEVRAYFATSVPFISM